MPKKNNLPKDKDSEKLDSKISESQNSKNTIRGFSESSETPNSRISEFSKVSRAEPLNSIESPYIDDVELQSVVHPVYYTIDDLIDVWCRGCTNGATLWQYCQDNNKVLPSSFEAGLIELVNEVRYSDNKEEALQAVLNNNMILLGVFDEKI